MANAGRILILPKGNYDANATYEMLDLVRHKGISWLATKTCTGIEPSDENTEYWFNFLGRESRQYDSANNLTTTEEGYLLDARQGKVLMDALGVTNTEVENTKSQIAEIQSALSDTSASLDEVETSIETVSESLATLQSNATIVKGTLEVGSTSIVLSDARITTNSMLSFYTSVWGVNPTSVTVASGQVTLKFDAQTVAVEVGVRIDG